MRIIINAEPEEMEYAMSLVVESFATFARHPERIGWGWNFGRPGKRSFFVRRTKGGFSATPSGAGAIALVSSRGVRDMAVTVSIETHPHGSSTLEESAAFTATLERLLGEDAGRLVSDGALPHRVADSDAADALIAELDALAAAHERAVHLRAWRS